MPGRSASWNRADTWLLGLLLSEFACQLVLLVPGIGGLRTLVRFFAFSGTLLCLVLVPGRGRSHPSAALGAVALAILVLGLLHPTTNSILAAFAVIGLYLAILSPLFWVQRLPVTVQTFERLLLVFWAFHTLSAAVGVLQTYYPGRFEATVANVVSENAMSEGLKIRLADGRLMWRPMGLTDVPGGAASSGMYAALFGLSLLLNARSIPLRGVALAGVGIGLFCIYLSYVRSLLIMCGICAASMTLPLIRRGELRKAFLLAGLIPLAGTATFVWAVAVGGEGVTKRFATLTESSAGDVYHKNRGHFLENTVNELLLQYPLGAGLGRYGMMYGYFGDKTDPNRGAVWAEIQITGWLYDGGVPLILTYGAAVLTAPLIAWRLVRSVRSDTLAGWVSLMFAYDIAAAALTFNYCVFMSQGGMEFWLLNASLFVAAAREPHPHRAGEPRMS